MRYETHDLDGRGPRKVRAYDMPVVDLDNYWPNVTDVPCPSGCGEHLGPAGTPRGDRRRQP